MVAIGGRCDETDFCVTAVPAARVASASVTATSLNPAGILAAPGRLSGPRLIVCQSPTTGATSTIPRLGQPPRPGDPDGRCRRRARSAHRRLHGVRQPLSGSGLPAVSTRGRRWRRVVHRRRPAPPRRDRQRPHPAPAEQVSVGCHAGAEPTRRGWPDRYRPARPQPPPPGSLTDLRRAPHRATPLPSTPPRWCPVPTRGP